MPATSTESVHRRLYAIHGPARKWMDAAAEHERRCELDVGHFGFAADGSAIEGEVRRESLLMVVGLEPQAGQVGERHRIADAEVPPEAAPEFDAGLFLFQQNRRVVDAPV